MGRKRLSVAPKRGLLYQFRVSLLRISPPIWRRIIVPESYSFWDLHVAIQDAMGWLDCHLHLFEFPGPDRNRIRIGISDGEGFDDNITTGWEVRIGNHFVRPGQTASYGYDFGDGWRHELLLEAISLDDRRERYPKCIAGERACPPEDCGGEPGYERLLAILADPRHAEYAETIRWLRGHAKNYHPYDPNAFNPKDVRFSNPRIRLKKAFS